MTNYLLQNKDVIYEVLTEQQQALTGQNAEETVAKLNNNNQNQVLENFKMDEIKTKFDRDLNTVTDFSDNIMQIGDKVYNNIERKKNNIKLQYRPEECQDPSCLIVKTVDMDNLKVPKTKEEAEILAQIYAHGIMNTTDKQVHEGAIQYTGEKLLDNASTTVRRPYDDVSTEAAYTVFERVRAGANIPSVFGASQASREMAQVLHVIDQYNQTASANGQPTVDVKETLHSLGASGGQNTHNWAQHKYGKQPFSNTKLQADLLGSSYPAEDFAKTAGKTFKSGEVNLFAAPKDGVAVGILPGSKHLPIIGIGRNETTAPNKNAGTYIIDLMKHHTDAYMRDERSMKFLLPTDTNDNVKNEFNKNERERIKNLHINQLWNQFEPTKKTIKFGEQ